LRSQIFQYMINSILYGVPRKEEEDGFRNQSRYDQSTGHSGLRDRAHGALGRDCSLAAFGLFPVLGPGVDRHTALGSPEFLWALLPIAALAAVFPVHPFDLIYNHGIRHLTGTGILPKRGAPARFACGLGAVWLAVTGWAFWSGNATLGYILGFSLVGVGTLVATTDICIPSMIFRAIFGPPTARAHKEAA
jgi:hypothetical protein